MNRALIILLPTIIIRSLLLLRKMSPLEFQNAPQQPAQTYPLNLHNCNFFWETGRAPVSPPHQAAPVANRALNRAPMLVGSSFLGKTMPPSSTPAAILSIGTGKELEHQQYNLRAF